MRYTVMAETRKKRPRDPIALAKLIGDIATGQIEDRVEDKPNPAAVALGKMGGAKGGWTRWKNAKEGMSRISTSRRPDQMGSPTQAIIYGSL
jgi:hypothetical protein